MYDKKYAMGMNLHYEANSFKEVLEIIEEVKEEWAEKGWDLDDDKDALIKKEGDGTFKIILHLYKE